MAPIRYSLHYEDYSEHLMSRFGKLLQMQSLVDMTLMCSSHTLRVHKAVLAASSAYFQELLQKQTGEPLIILKMRFSVLKCLVEFMYCGKTQCLEENLDELVSAAQFLKIKGLSKVTKEGLGIANNSELPIFTPPVVINRPPQSLIDLHAQENDPKLHASQLTPATSTSQLDNHNRANKDMVVRIPFDIDNGGGTPAIDYADVPRTIRPRRGRPSVRRPGGWNENSSSLGRAAERALLRREQDSRKAIHHLKHLQSRHMQDYMDRVTISQAVNSICGPEASSSNFMSLDNDINIYMDQTVSSNNLDSSLSYPKATTSIEGINSTYSTTNTNCADTANSEMNITMSQYVNALKSAGLPTDLPILFESGDGSYINVNEQVLLDMVQSSEIQYEVIEQPNIIEKVAADPSEIKSIDDLSKSFERGEMMLGNKNYTSNEYGKDSTQYNNQDDTINSLNAILPDNLESYTDQQNYVVMGSHIQENSTLNSVNSADFSCIDGDYFTKSMNDDVKKYYENQHLNDARDIDQLCPASTTLEPNLSLLDTKITHLNDNLNQQYNPLNIDDLKRNDDCYDFGLHLPQNNGFKVDALDSLIATPKRNEGNSFEDNYLNERENKERDEIIKDLMNIENKINLAQDSGTISCAESKPNSALNEQDFNVDAVFNEPQITNTSHSVDTMSENETRKTKDDNNPDIVTTEKQCVASVIDLTEPTKTSEWDGIMNEEKENSEDNSDNISHFEDDVPYAVGLLPLKQLHVDEGVSLSKRKSSIAVDDLDNVNAKCSKSEVKYKNM